MHGDSTQRMALIRAEAGFPQARRCSAGFPWILLHVGGAEIGHELDSLLALVAP